MHQQDEAPISQLAPTPPTLPCRASSPSLQRKLSATRQSREPAAPAREQSRQPPAGTAGLPAPITQPLPDKHPAINLPELIKESRRRSAELRESGRTSTGPYVPQTQTSTISIKLHPLPGHSAASFSDESLPQLALAVQNNTSKLLKDWYQGPWSVSATCIRGCFRVVISSVNLRYQRSPLNTQQMQTPVLEAVRAHDRAEETQETEAQQVDSSELAISRRWAINYAASPGRQALCSRETERDVMSYNETKKCLPQAPSVSAEASEGEEGSSATSSAAAAQQTSAVPETVGGDSPAAGLFAGLDSLLPPQLLNSTSSGTVSSFTLSGDSASSMVAMAPLGIEQEVAASMPHLNAVQHSGTVATGPRSIDGADILAHVTLLEPCVLTCMPVRRGRSSAGASTSASAAASAQGSSSSTGSSSSLQSDPAASIEVQLTAHVSKPLETGVHKLLISCDNVVLLQQLATSEDAARGSFQVTMLA